MYHCFLDFTVWNNIVSSSDFKPGWYFSVVSILAGIFNLLPIRLVFFFC